MIERKHNKAACGSVRQDSIDFLDFLENLFHFFQRLFTILKKIVFT